MELTVSWVDYNGQFIEVDIWSTIELITVIMRKNMIKKQTILSISKRKNSGIKLSEIWR